MSEKRSSTLLLFDIYQSVEKIEEFTRGISFDQLLADERTKDAILRNLQVIGEASKTCRKPSSQIILKWTGVGLPESGILLRTGISV